MTTVNDIYRALCELAPLELQYDFDNSGFLIGHAEYPVSRALLSLDVTDEVVDEAIAGNYTLIVSHHPKFFTPLHSVTDRNCEGQLVLKLIEHGIAVISMHTNLDIAEGGVNDVLMQTLGIRTRGPLDEDGCGRIGDLEAAIPLSDFLSLCKSALRCPGLRYVDVGRAVRHVAVMGGSGSGSIERAAALGCDTYVTADIKYHQFQKAIELNINLIDAGHFSTENPVIPVLAEKLSAQFPVVEFHVSDRHHPIIRFA